MWYRVIASLPSISIKNWKIWEEGGACRGEDDCRLPNPLPIGASGIKLVKGVSAISSEGASSMPV